MIGYLKGNVGAILDDLLIIDVNGVGYNVYVPINQLAMINGCGDEIKLYTHMTVREDAMTLYGFMSYDDLKLFKLLIGVSGVGPKYALGLLSTFNVSDLRLAILANDAKTISKAPGIGLKSAQKIILELKDKISMEDVIHSHNNTNISIPSEGMSGDMEDAIDALVALGYSTTDALRAVRNCSAEESDDCEMIIKKALKIIKR